MQKLPTVKSCCFCISLKIGAIIISVLSIVLGLFNGARYTSAIVDLVVAILGITFFICSIILLIAIIIKKHALVRIWVFVALICCIVLVILNIVSIVLNFNILPIIMILIQLLFFYFILVVNSHWKVMRGMMAAPPPPEPTLPGKK